MTTQEKKERQKRYNRAHYLKNIEKVKAKNEAYRLSNKDKTKIYSKTYREVNRDKIVANRDRQKEYNRNSYLRNKEGVRVKNKANHESNKLPYNIVYCIPNYNGKGDNYAGVTNQPKSRMANHKTQGKLNVSNWYELGRCDCREEAEALEDAFHKLGYHGSIVETRARNAA